MWKPGAMTSHAKIITVFNQKGGCGKTTTSMSLAGELGRRGFSVQVVDLDPQATSSKWKGQASDRFPFPASVINLSHHGNGTLAEIQLQAQKYDFLIIDCPPAIMEASLSAALLVSDLALMPIQPSPADIWALDGAKRLLSAAQMINTSLQACVVPMAVQRKQKMTIETIALLEEDPDLKVSKCNLGLLSAYRTAMAAGRAVHDVPGAGTAAKEVEALADEVTEMLGVPSSAQKGGAA